MDALLEFRQIGRLLWESGLVSSHGGNLSVRHDDLVTITRTGCPLGSIEEDDLVVPDGPSTHKPSMDTPIHLAI